MSEYDWLLFLHLLAAFAAVATVVIFSAFAFGWTRDRRVLTLATVLWAIGGLGTIGFGIWLAIYLDAYKITDGWIIAAIVLWVIGSAIGGRLGAGYRKVASSGAAPDPSALVMNLALIVTLLVILIDMIYKPGAS